MREGWEVKTLGELCTVITKGTTPTSVGYSFIDEGVNFVKIESISLDGKFIPNKFAHISEEAHIALKRSQLQDGDILFSIAGALGRTALVTTKILPANTNQALSIIRLKDETIIAKEYLLSALSTGFTLEQVEKFKGGVAQLNLSLTQMKSFQIPIPPLPEQAQIVNTLDRAFKQIDQAKVNLEKNLHNAKELFQSKLNEVFSQRGEGWEEKRLGDVCTLYQGLAINKKTKHLLVKKSTIPLLRIKDLKNNTEEQYVSEVGYPKNSFVTEDEIIYTRTGSLGLVFRGKNGVLHNNSFKVVPNKELTNNYLFWWLQHEAFTKIIISLASKAAQPDITHKLFKEQIISIPSIEMQNSYYSEIEELNKLSNNLQTYYKQKLNNLEELKKSILQKAFRGELDYDEL